MFKQIFIWWNQQTIGTRLFTIFFGKYVGNDDNGNKQFYIHYHQIDNNRIVSGERTFELINFNWNNPYQIVHLKRESGALTIPIGTFHRSVSGLSGSIVINQAIRDDLFKAESEFKPVSICNNKKLSEVILNTQPLIHKKVS